MKSILNHFWWSNATCQENPVTIREKWFCVLQYVKHDWGDNQFYHCCERGPLSTEKEKAKKQLSESYPAYNALKLKYIVPDENILLQKI